MLNRRGALTAIVAMPAIASTPVAAQALAGDPTPIATYLVRRTPAAVAADLQRGAVDHAGIRYFNLGWDWPDQIEAECARNGIATVGQFNAWCMTMARKVDHADVAALEALIGKVPAGIDPATMPALSVGEIHVGIMAAQANATGGICGLAPGHQARAEDASYRLATEAQWDAILQAYPGARLPYMATDNDCGKSQRNFSGWLASKRLGTLAMATARLLMYYQGQQLRNAGHIVAMVVTSNRRAWFLEAQTRRRLPLDFTAFKGYSGTAADNFLRADASRISDLDF